MRILVLSLALSLACVAAPAAPGAPHAHPAKASLRAFDNEAEFQALLERWRDAARQRQQDVRRRSDIAGGLALQAAPSAASMSESAAKASADSGAPGGANESITNVQTAGVDEGGIVKRPATTW